MMEIFSKPSKLQVYGSVRGDFKCTWVIRNFRLFDAQIGRCYESEVFQLEENGKKWHLAVYPGGETVKDIGTVTFLLYSKIETLTTTTTTTKPTTSQTNCSFSHLPPPRNEKSKYVISLRNSKGAILFDGMANGKSVDPLQAGSGHFETIKAKDLAPQLVDGILVVVLEATYCATTVKNSLRIPEIFSQENVIGDWRKLWNSKQNADGVICVEGKEIPVHSLVLSTRSEAFAATFAPKTSKKPSRRVDITEFDEGTMRSLVEFIYTGSIQQKSYDLALKLLRAGDKYNVNDLKSYCASYLMPIINDANACQILEIAITYNAELLCDLAFEYIRENLSEADLEARSEFFKKKPDLLWNFFKQTSKKRKRSEEH